MNHNWEKYPDESGLNYCTLCGLLSNHATLECKNGNVYENRTLADVLKKRKRDQKKQNQKN